MVSVVSAPPHPFEPLVDELAADSLLYRSFRVRPGRTAATFNPGIGPGTRFAFFGDPVVPVLYAAETVEAAIAETLLHDIPVRGGVLLSSIAEQHVVAGLRPKRALRLARFHGLGLRRLGVTAAQLTDTAPTEYGETVRWAAAAHHAGFDGISWMSAKCNSDRAYVLFGDRVAESDLRIDPSVGISFATLPGRSWLAAFCRTLDITLTPPQA